MLSVIENEQKEPKEQKEHVVDLPPAPKEKCLPCPQPSSTNHNLGSERFFRLEREKRYDHISIQDILSNNYQLDSDVYEYNKDGSLMSDPIILHKQKYITNSSFETLAQLNAYLREKGKIPAFLEVRESKGKGLGVFASRPIAAQTFLGHYEGINRASCTSMYGFALIGFDGKPRGSVDSDNILFSNFTRWINDGKTPNISYSQLHNQILVHALTDISEGTELLGNYGNTYFTSHNVIRLD